MLYDWVFTISYIWMMASIVFTGIKMLRRYEHLLNCEKLVSENPKFKSVKQTVVLKPQGMISLFTPYAVVSTDKKYWLKGFDSDHKMAA
jgi:hypothetical protein